MSHCVFYIVAYVCVHYALHAYNVYMWLIKTHGSESRGQGGSTL